MELYDLDLYTDRLDIAPGGRMTRFAYLGAHGKQRTLWFGRSPLSNLSWRVFGFSPGNAFRLR